MGKVNRGSLVSTRRRLVKASGPGGKRSRTTPAGKVNLPLPPPPPSQSLVLDEDSGFGGDQSLDSEPSLLSVPNVTGPGVVLPSLAMVPQTLTLRPFKTEAVRFKPCDLKLLLVSLLQGAGGLPGLGTGQNASANVAVGASPPTTQGSVSNGTRQTGNTHGAVLSRGAEKETQGSHSARPLLAAAPVVCPAASANSPSNYPTEPVALGSAGIKVVEGHLGLKGQVDLNEEEAQELPASQSPPTATHTAPLVSFRDVSLLSSLHTFKGTSTAGNLPLLRVEGAAQTCGVTSKPLRLGVPHSPPPLTTQLSPRSSDGTVELKLVTQPEEQHRARYQTEGSRGAVKDRSGAGHPLLSKATTLQIFVGSDSGKSGPHMFYQVCRVSGKNSTPCRERRVEGTVVIEAALQPDNDMVVSCDCVGILKERNVDVEHRFKAVMSRGRKKSTKCRLVFRAFVTLPSGVQEVLQVVSQPIACTQPPGVPEICRKSISSCSVTGGEEIFIFGKNFLKDTVVVFQQNGTKVQPIWEEKVLPDKESLQPIHLIVDVPKYYDQSMAEEVTVEMVVVSGGKKSEPQSFTYLPLPSPSKKAHVCPPTPSPGASPGGPGGTLPPAKYYYSMGNASHKWQLVFVVLL
ncbi:Nuclear factor of activated T-cells 5 [Chionoecetes opilio]|uniref:Nuclear factor of activated T-cells 5 n=1 Tax=Chionoecetes opilio TaxID=41210 RepID=A0A8J5CVK6_CHIOP|nr:Nuclear factor of activated T-cells 5 [Chionoecetes opilio]